MNPPRRRSAQDAAFAPGSISLRLYPHNELEAPAIVAELCAQAALAADVGFDGVMTSEHHGGFAGYLPNPLQITGWLLAEMNRGWAAPCPILMPLRPLGLLAEEIAWLNARFPGRVGVGVAPGAWALDFEAMDLTLDDAMVRFRADLPRVVAMFAGDQLGQLSGDRALGPLTERPIPLVSTAMSPAAARRAAAAGAGLLFDGVTSPDRLAEITAAHREAEGTGPRVLVRRVWLGDPPQSAFARQDEVYRRCSPGNPQQHWRGTGWITSSVADEIAELLVSDARVAGADALNIRIHAPGITPHRVRDQIAALSVDVLPRVRQRLTPGP